MAKSLNLDLTKIISADAMDEAAEQVKDKVANENNGTLSKAAMSLGGAAIGQAIMEKLKDYDIIEQFAQGWADNPALQAVVKMITKPEVPTAYRMGKFNQQIDLLPEISLSSLGISSKPIQFMLTLNANFDALEIAVHNFHLTHAGGGFCALSGTLKLGDFTFPSSLPPQQFQLAENKIFAAPGIKIGK